MASSMNEENQLTERAWSSCCGRLVSTVVAEMFITNNETWSRLEEITPYQKKQQKSAKVTEPVLLSMP